MVTLTLHPQKNSKAIRLVLKRSEEGESWEEIAPAGDDLIKALDKLLKTANIRYNSLKVIKVYPEQGASLTSLRLAKTFQQALNTVKSLKTQK